MATLTRLDELYDAGPGSDLPLPLELAAIYGRLRLPVAAGRPYVVGNFVTTLDGVATLDAKGRMRAADIRGPDEHDRMVMGLLRAAADAVIVGAGTLRSAPGHIWTAERAYPPLADAYGALRAALGKPGPPLNAFVTARGEVDLTRPVFRSGEAPVLIVTTTEGERRIREADPPAWVTVSALRGGSLSARAVLEAVAAVRPSQVILVEGGPHLMGDFFAEGCLDELFLTLAPQVAGRDGLPERPGFVAGKQLAPEHPAWGTLLSVKRAGSHLFLRYGFGAAEAPSERGG